MMRLRSISYFHQSSWSAGPSLISSVLMAFLAVATVISIYLMYIQSRGDHHLPPVNSRLVMINHKEWCNQPDHPPPVAGAAATPYKHVAVVETGTVTCSNVAGCTKLLQDLQEIHHGALPYNFLVSSNGVTFEALGWKYRSPMFPQYPLVVAFIGHFAHVVPTAMQLGEAFTLIEHSNEEGHVTKDFTIVGKIAQTGHVPTYLFESLQNATKWDTTLSDDYKPPQNSHEDTPTLMKTENDSHV